MHWTLGHILLAFQASCSSHQASIWMSRTVASLPGARYRHPHYQAALDTPWQGTHVYYRSVHPGLKNTTPVPALHDKWVVDQTPDSTRAHYPASAERQYSFLQLATIWPH